MYEPLVVPVRSSAAGSLVLLTARLAPGRERVGVAFSDETALRAALGDVQPWVRLSEPALRALLRPMGVLRIQVDPLFAGPAAPMKIPA